MRSSPSVTLFRSAYPNRRALSFLPPRPPRPPPRPLFTASRPREESSSRAASPISDHDPPPPYKSGNPLSWYPGKYWHVVARTAGSKLFQSRKLVEFSMVDSAVRLCVCTCVECMCVYLCVCVSLLKGREGGKERERGRGEKHLLSCARTTFEGREEGRLPDRYCSAACKVINTVERRIVSLAC